MSLPKPSPGKKLIAPNKYLETLLTKYLGTIGKESQGPWLLIIEFLALGINHHRGN